MKYLTFSSLVPISVSLFKDLESFLDLCLAVAVRLAKGYFRNDDCLPLSTPLQ